MLNQKNIPMTIVKHRPLVGTFDDLLSTFFGRDLSQFVGNDEAPRYVPRVNVVERKDRFTLELAAAGFTKDELKLKVEEKMLTIHAEKETEKNTSDVKFTRREFNVASFSRSFRLPEGLDTDHISAAFENGVLTIELPKAKPAEPQSRTIHIG